MYLVPVEVKKSLIHGKGVFTKAEISKGAIVWKFKAGHDKRLSPEAYDSLSRSDRKGIEQTAYLSPQSDMWVIPPLNDPACFTNHSSKANLSVVFDKKVSDEPIFVANRKIEAGEEITNNYKEFDESTNDEQASWLN